MHVVTYKRDMLIKMDYRQTEGISYTDNEWAFTPLLNVQTLYYFDKEVYSYLRGRPGQTMDPVIMQKYLHHHLLGIKAMVNSIDDIGFDSKEKEVFMFQALLNRIHNTYGDYLFAQDSNIDLSSLVELDLYIKSKCPTLSIKMESLDYGKMMKSYIRKWRKSGYKKRFRFYKMILQMYKRFKSV